MKPYAPTALAPNDPFALVCSLVLVPLLVAGYMATALLTKALGSTSGPWHGVWLLGFALAAGLVVDLIVTYGSTGSPPTRSGSCGRSWLSSSSVSRSSPLCCDESWVP